MLALNTQLDIDKQDILSHIGYNDDYQPSGRIASMVDDYIENYHDLLAPSCAYVIRDIVGVEGKRVTIENDITFESGVVARLAEKSCRMAVFALTIGNYLEEMVAHLAEGHLVLQATVLDAVGSGVAEKLAACVGEKINALAAAEGLVTSRRFSPGYCDWEVSQQELVFRALGEGTAGIRLTRSLLMIPRKSVSGVIGIGPAEKEVDRYNPCGTCKKKDCPGRRK